MDIWVLWASRLHPVEAVVSKYAVIDLVQVFFCGQKLSSLWGGVAGMQGKLIWPVFYSD